MAIEHAGDGAPEFKLGRITLAMRLKAIILAMVLACSTPLQAGAPCEVERSVVIRELKSLITKSLADGEYAISLGLTSQLLAFEPNDDYALEPHKQFHHKTHPLKVVNPVGFLEALRIAE